MNTACGRMMPPSLNVCDGLTSPADAACRSRMNCEIFEVIRYVAGWQHWFDYVNTNFLLYDNDDDDPCSLVPATISPKM